MADRMTEGEEERPPAAMQDRSIPGATPKHSTRPGSGPTGPVAEPERVLTHIPQFVRDGINLASSRLGARAVRATDEFFAPLSRMLSSENPVWREGVYDDNGKWMDGWESRRKRTPGHDHAVIALACAGRVTGFDVDTSYFTGNYPPEVSIEAINTGSVSEDPEDDAEWIEVLPRSPLGPNTNHFLYCHRPTVPWTHLRVHIYPDGGIARLRAYGTPEFDWNSVDLLEEVDLVHAFHGGRAAAFSDAHYGHPERMLAPGRGVNMGDGWETARRRGAGHDWTVLKLGHPGYIRRAIVDTAHFKGNYPHHCLLRGAALSSTSEGLPPSSEWRILMPGMILGPDAVHAFDVDTPELVTHVRFEIHPDGGVSRLRLIGSKADPIQ